MAQSIKGESVSVSQKPGRGTTPLNEYVIAIIATALVTVASSVLEPLTGYLAIALLYLLLVVAVGIKLHRGPVLLVAASSALIWDFFFIPPRFNLHIANLNDLMMFSMFFVVAIAMGHLTSQLRLSERAEATAAHRGPLRARASSRPGTRSRCWITCSGRPHGVALRRPGFSFAQSLRPFASRGTAPRQLFSAR